MKKPSVNFIHQFDGNSGWENYFRCSTEQVNTYSLDLCSSPEQTLASSPCVFGSS